MEMITLVTAMVKSTVMVTTEATMEMRTEMKMREMLMVRNYHQFWHSQIQKIFPQSISFSK